MPASASAPLSPRTRFYEAAKELFEDPIRAQPFEDPVFDELGQLHNRQSIEAWFATGSQTSPLTREVLLTGRLITAWPVRQLMEAHAGVAHALRPPQPRSSETAASLQQPTQRNDTVQWDTDPIRSLGGLLMAGAVILPLFNEGPFMCSTLASGAMLTGIVLRYGCIISPADVKLTLLGMAAIVCKVVGPTLVGAMWHVGPVQVGMIAAAGTAAIYCLR